MIPTGRKLKNGRLFSVEEMKLTKADLWSNLSFLPEQSLIEYSPPNSKYKTEMKNYYSKTFENKENIPNDPR